MSASREERLRQLVAEWRSWSVGHAGSEEMEAYVRSMRLCADELDAVLHEAASPAAAADWSGRDTSRLEMTHGEAAPADLLKAPCRWCGYNGNGYWQNRTHRPDCPWYLVAGAVDRADVCVRSVGVREAASPKSDVWQPVLREAVEMARVTKLTPGCDCDQNGNEDIAYHATDCLWRQRITRVTP